MLLPRLGRSSRKRVEIGWMFWQQSTWFSLPPSNPVSAVSAQPGKQQIRPKTTQIDASIEKWSEWLLPVHCTRGTLTLINLSGQAWLSGSYPIPDSMQDCWGGNGNYDNPNGDSGNSSINENVTKESSTG